MTSTELEHTAGWTIDTFEGHLFTDDPVDAGGATKFGITQRTLAYWRKHYLGLQTTTKKDVMDLTRELAVKIAIDVFATENRLAEFKNWRTFLIAYDYHFHSGNQAIEDLQRILGVASDGLIGRQTLEAEATSHPVFTSFKLLTAREEFMERLIERKPSQRKYMFGWWIRTTKIQRKLLEGL